ncbi:MAG TPA: putative sugar O-methyltransferase [Thermoleophilaceae bacterium]|nr:putative sugar O-methyltransferase [Thermoleophilaceae bacterium]
MRKLFPPEGQGRRLLRRRRGGLQPHPDLIRLSPEDWRYLTTLHDDTVPLPPDADTELSPDHPRLRELRESYAELDLPVSSSSRWTRDAVESFLDLRYFRGETMITWHYRELPRITALKYFLFVREVQQRDEQGLLAKLGEDGAFGCWTYSYPGYGRFSRDLLDSVNEVLFLERQLELSKRERFTAVDIGAGYGRLAHRMVSAYPRIADYCCVDAIPESTFVSDYYLGFRGCKPRARVVPLTAVEAELQPGSFDLAINVHSFSECTYAAVEWWIDLLERLAVPRLFLVPNEPTDLLTLEPDGSRRDFAPLLERAGYRLARREPAIEDLAVRELLRLHDHFHLFELEGAPSVGA